MKNLLRLIPLALFLAIAPPAMAQSACTAIIDGAVLTAAQWNSCFTPKQDTSTAATLTGTQTLTNKRLTAPNVDTPLQVQNAGSSTNEVIISHDGTNGTVKAQAGSLLLGAGGSTVITVNPSGMNAPLGQTTPAAIAGTTGTFSGNITGNITGSTQCVQSSTAGLLSGTGSPCGLGAIPTRFVFTTATSGTYTRTNSNVRQLWVRMCGGGGGGSGWNGASTGGTGGTSSFGSTTAVGGSGGTTGISGGVAGSGGSGGTAGANTGATSPLRTLGGRGNDGTLSTGSPVSPGGVGGAAIFGGAGAPCTGGTGGTGGNGGSGGGGGAGEGVDFLVNAPGATIAYTVAVGGTASTGGSTNGNAGAPGAIFIEERY